MMVPVGRISSIFHTAAKPIQVNCPFQGAVRGACSGGWIQADVATVDSDEDGIADSIDRCPAVPDPLQPDGDQDGVGDACDSDALPDLTVLSQTTPTGTILPGQTLAFSASLKNNGTGAAASFPVTFHLSANATFEPSVDVPVGDCWVESLAAGATTGCSTSTARIPPSFRTGQPGPVTYRWIGCANRAQVERQSNPANDCVLAPQSVSVPEPTGTLGLSILAMGLLADARSRRRRRLERGS